MWFATTNSRLPLWAAGLALALAPAAPAVEGQGSAAALQVFRQTQAKCQEQPADARAGWQFGRACFDLADYATNNAEREAIAVQGIAACRQVTAREPKSAPAHYYLGLNLGQLARTRNLGALKLVDEMEQEFTRALELDATFDYAGAERSLGLLYRDAPALVSIGSRSRARAHLQRAIQLAPEYPENRLNMVESALKWGDRSVAAREMAALDESWPKARAEFAGPAWTSSWADWEARRQQARKKLAPPTRIEAPRH